ncbi:formamidopyrimidine-DNA glycosylase isoform X1 [Arabidopsis lyrata subsp. lyrata]|uniref:formamidopyrimidine-DNA glycosylase isoform X1 n=1 Tax=Arabidopsis lyrata subsp. lyrata TaxID=81972 RepID=UPI000A29E2B4|nr:formamidopyrimidine-DNA glycosylase isoform X1 [Arabidopsis lyrata subsp. lyrata]|eukprot:XP_020868690.1 formamidopyrimidine-DNA glycosylase isoform X1 [Arabidopsis lyrata subsp. lyrata]
MPELPEVEAARRAIEENCLGKKIKRVIIADDNKVIHGISPSDFQISILGKTIVSARRKGKNLWLELDSPPFPSFQFGMAGAIYIKGVAVTKYKRSAVKDSEEWPSKYSKFFVELDDGLELSFTDKRRFAKVRLLENPTSVSPISELGPDALLEPMTVEEFAENLAKKKITIKPLLLDQGFISGIGNWIADEVLYQARIHPLQSASSLSKEQCEALHTSIKEVIEKAVEVDADSSQFPSNWIFHDREKKPGKAFVDGKKIDFITAGGRTTAYVPELQKLSGKDAEKAAKVRPAKRGVKPKEDDGEGEEDEQESEKEDESAKTKKGQKPRGGRGKKPASKRKTEDSDDEDDDADGGDDSEAEEKVVKPRGRGTKPATKRKSEEKATSQAGKKPKGRKS